MNLFLNIAIAFVAFWLLRYLFYYAYLAWALWRDKTYGVLWANWRASRLLDIADWCRAIQGWAANKALEITKKQLAKRAAPSPLY